MTKKKTIGEKIGEEIEEADRLLFKEEKYESALDLLIKLLKKYEEATPYQIAKIGDRIKFATEKIAHKKADAAWHSNTIKSQDKEK